MPKIKINPDQVRGVGRQFRSEGEHIDEISTQLRRAIHSLDTWNWSGQHRANIEPLLDQIPSQANRLENEMHRLGQLLSKIADAFEQQDNTAAGNLTSLPWVDFPDSPGASFVFPFPIFIPTKPWEHLFPNKLRSFERSWDSWSVDERLNYLRGVHDDLTQEYGLTSIEVKMEDLLDTKLWGLTIIDKRGVYRGDEIVIDIDNLRDSDGEKVLTTLIHETRHQIQWEMVERYRIARDDVQLPPDISLDQVKEWDRNFDNYIQSEDDFEGYRKQPIERDARDFAEDYLDEALPEPNTRHDMA